MSKGAKPGERRGGRKKGVPNKWSVEQIAEAAARANDAQRNGKKFAIEVLDDLMHTALSFAAQERQHVLAEQQGAKGKPGKATAETLDRFWKAMEYAGIFARALAPFQHPKFRAVVVMPSPGAMEPLGPVIPGEIVQTNDPGQAARLYSQLVRVVK